MEISWEQLLEWDKKHIKNVIKEWDTKKWVEKMNEKSTLKWYREAKVHMKGSEP